MCCFCLYYWLCCCCCCGLLLLLCMLWTVSSGACLCVCLFVCLYLCVQADDIFLFFFESYFLCGFWYHYYVSVSRGILLIFLFSFSLFLISACLFFLLCLVLFMCLFLLCFVCSRFGRFSVRLGTKKHSSPNPVLFLFDFLSVFKDRPYSCVVRGTWHFFGQCLGFVF